MVTAGSLTNAKSQQICGMEIAQRNPTTSSVAFPIRRTPVPTKVVRDQDVANYKETMKFGKNKEMKKQTTETKHRGT